MSEPSSNVIAITDRLNRVVVPNREPLRLGEAFIRARHTISGIPTLVRWARAWWLYDGIRYVELDDEKLIAQLFAFLDVCVTERVDAETGSIKRERLTARAKMVNEVKLALLKVAPQLDGGAPQWTTENELAHDPDPASLVVVNNGLLDVDTLDLRDPTPRLFATTAIGTHWDPDAAAPHAWLTFLRQVWGDDEETIVALQQIFGYLLTPDTSQQKIFAIVGPPRSGKGSIARVLKALLGDEAVVNPTLGSLERPFGLAPLVGKTVAIIGDARLGGRADQAQVVERLLSISGEDAISIDRKNRDPINVRLRVRVLLISNELPRLYDTSGALASRFLILSTKKSFLGAEDTTLEGRLLAELPSILKWAIAGRASLHRSNRFVAPAASCAAQQELEAITSPITVFVEDALVIEAGAETEIGVLYERYTSWCKANGREPRDKQNFGRELRTAIPDLAENRPRRPDGSRPRCYQGVRLA